MKPKTAHKFEISYISRYSAQETFDRRGLKQVYINKIQF